MFNDWNFIEYRATEESASGAATEDLTVNETIELLGEEDDDEKIDLDEDKDAKKEKKENIKDKEDEEDDEETEDEESDDDLDDETDIITPPRRKEILAKYPQLFKDFPYLNRAYFREQQFTEMFPTMKDAKEAINKGQTLDKFESDLLDGNTEKILASVKNHDEKAFYKIVDNYLDTLGKVDKNAYYTVVGGIISDTVTAMVKEAKNNKNEALETAAAILNQFVFATSDFVPKTKLSKEEDTSKQDEISNRERALLTRQYESSKDELSNKVNNVLKATIEGNIDPKESMTPYVRRTASREAFEEVVSLVDRDSRFKQVLDRLWRQALDNNFDRNSLDKIKSAYLSKARTLLPTVIKKARNEALKGLGRSVKEDVTEETENEIETKVRKTSKSGHTTSSHNSGKSDKDRAKQIPKEMSTRDYLMSD